MLHQLSIQNYALIDELNVSFHPHFNIITGETGAGKSILIGALSLVLGERADSSVLRNVEKKCIVEAVFKIDSHKEIRDFFNKEDLDFEDSTLTIRREIIPGGKSRSFINDTPVNLSQLRQLSNLLIDLHQQFDTLELEDNAFQRNVIDAIANHSSLLEEYQGIYKQHVSEQKTLQQLKDQQASFNQESDYTKFLYNELEEASFKQSELEELEKELQLLNNAENIKNVLATANHLLKESEQPLVPQIKNLIQQLNNLKSNHSEINAITQRLQSAHIELTDIADELERVNDEINMDPEKLQILNDRLSLGYKLLKKHNVQTTAELLSIQQQLSNKLQQVFNVGQTIGEKEKLVEQLLKKATDLANKISSNRKKVIPDFELKVASLLKRVGMPNALIKINISNSSLNNFGADNIEFLFDANKSGRLEPLGKVASGGELNRLMLSIKSIVAKSMQLPTLIFDEIDTGISGEAARQVGGIMKELAKYHQVIAITHQPQIAAKADIHHFVFKQEKAGTIQTQIKQLNDEERIEIIANMLAGDNPSEIVLQNAKEMLTSPSAPSPEREVV